MKQLPAMELKPVLMSGAHHVKLCMIHRCWPTVYHLNGVETSCA